MAPPAVPSTPVKHTVIGGGIAGLVIARRLAMSGREVTLLEASDRLGGTLASHRVAGIDMDAGAEAFSVRNGTVAALATELGLADQIVDPLSSQAWLHPVAGPALRLPASALLGIPGVPLASDVIAIVGQRAALRAQLDSLIPALWARKSLTLGGLVSRRMGSGVLDRLVVPLVQGVYSLHPDELSVDRVHGLRAAYDKAGSLAAAVRDLEGSASGGTAVQGIRGGVNRLVTELTADLDTFGVTVVLGRRARASEIDKPGVIVAAPGLVAPVRGRTVVLATLVLDQPELDAAPRGTGVIAARGSSGIRARSLTHATAKWEWLRERAQGKHVVRLTYDEAPEDLADTARQDAAALLGVPLTPSSVLDYDHVEWTRPAAVIAPTGVVVVGETVGGTGIAGIVAHAEATARRLLAE